MTNRKQPDREEPAVIKHSLNDGPAVALDALRQEQARRVAEHLTDGASAGWRDATSVWFQHQWPPVSDALSDFWHLIVLGRAAKYLDNEHTIRYRCKRARTQAGGQR